ncbi:MAG TPA: TonB-dependent receptor [Reyranellaceae bacterium]|nr:TonB-dependent receptor [Reyranellaceae bacterium]
MKKSLAGALLALLAPAAPLAQETYVLPPTVITATGRPEQVTRIAGTIQVIPRDTIEKSAARSVTELFAENAVGFMSEWTAGQTSINIRGAATEGQGRDFRSQVLVLINGRRAGTANISKLSIADVERIEIVRGPSSVVYGSQNMGGVVNIMLKTGRTAPGSLVEASAGSWNLIQGKAQHGGSYDAVDYYFGLAAGRRDNYQVGGGNVEQNTMWNRLGGTLALGWKIDEDQRVDVMVRTDGVYATGFRGSSANIFAIDDRFNRSLDATYNLRTADGKGGLFLQAYYVQDVDDLNNPSPLSGLNAAASRTVLDRNRRQLDIAGARLQPRYRFWEGNELLLGIDWERSWLRSERWRAGGTAVTQLSPQDNNQTENVFAFYAEDSQTFFDRLTVRGGIRYTTGTTSLDWTPSSPTLVPNSNPYQATTYSAGATLKVFDWLSTRFGASTGFRAPTATELGANFTTTPIGTTIFGNPGIQPETSRQIEAGATLGTRSFRLDGALFRNVISNRIAPVTVSSVGGVVIQRQQNNAFDIVIEGLELQADLDVARTLALPGDWRWRLFGNGYYNFKMIDYGATPSISGTDKAMRINEYQLVLGTQVGQETTQYPWNLRLVGILRGPMYYNTEESLASAFFPGQARNVSVYRKEAFWVWNTRGEVEITKGLRLFAAVNNIFDVNQHPIFIALDSSPCTANQANQNGACGNSIPGREFLMGFQARF